MLKWKVGVDVAHLVASPLSSSFWLYILQITPHKSFVTSLEVSAPKMLKGIGK